MGERRKLCGDACVDYADHDVNHAEDVARIMDEYVVGSRTRVYEGVWRLSFMLS